MQERYKLKESAWLWYLGLKNGIPRLWCNFIEFTYIPTREVSLINRIMTQSKISAMMYKHMMEDKMYFDMSKYATNWFKMFNTDQIIDSFLDLFRSLQQLIWWVKLHNFQYRLLLGKICVNDTLYKWKLIETPVCEWCGDEEQTIVHILYSCQFIKCICVTVLSLLEMHSGGNVRRPRCRPSSPGVLGASDLILIYYWGRLRSAVPTGGGPCSAVLRHLRAANTLVRV